MFYLLGVIIGLVISFLITAIMIWILALGVWVIYLIIRAFLQEIKEDQ